MRITGPVAAFLAGMIAACVYAGGAERPAEILKVAEKTADWQLAHLDTGHKPVHPDDQMSPRGWVFGTFYDGLSALADVSPDPRFATAIRDAGARQNWGLEVRPFHADDYVIGRAWARAYQISRDPAEIAPLKARLDAIIAAHPQNSLEYGTNPPPFVESACQKRWCWADALFMGPASFALMSRVTGDPKYQAYADAEFKTSADFLFDPQAGLFARDGRVKGKDIFWSRGNGWVFAGLVHMLQLTPADDPARAMYLKYFRAMAARLVTLQKPDGTWPVSLTRDPAGTPPETSGTAFFTYGFAYGVRTGILTGPEARQAALKGWNALQRAVLPDGKLGWVQGIGVGPDKVKRDDTAPFGVGAFLLAASETYQLALQESLNAASVTAVGQGYAVSNVNAVSMARDALISRGNYQFAFLYGPVKNGRVPVSVYRRNRKLAPGFWAVAATPFSTEDAYSNTGARDDHNIISAGIDGKGYLHLIWGMHNVPLTYAVSDYPVTGKTFPKAIAFHKGHMLGRDENEVTYPEFFHAPDGALMFAYRNGGAGGGSGNGNEYINRYDVKAAKWQRIADPVIDGMSTSMNGYLNSFAYGPAGNLFISWTIRETPLWTSNHNIYLARSADGGKTWMNFAGAHIGRTIDRAASDTKAKIYDLPQHSGLINQTSMTVDKTGTPMIASWWAPDYAAGNNTRQYMLLWRDGKAWRASQITHRGAEPMDENGSRVRDMGRPVVLSDPAGRSFVITRYAQSGTTIKDAANRVVIFWSVDKVHWNRLFVRTQHNPGMWEPVADSRLWKTSGRLSLLFQPAGLGNPDAAASVITWDVKAAFAR